MWISAIHSRRAGPVYLGGAPASARLRRFAKRDRRRACGRCDFRPFPCRYSHGAISNVPKMKFVGRLRTATGSSPFRELTGPVHSYLASMRFDVFRLYWPPRVRVLNDGSRRRRVVARRAGHALDDCEAGIILDRDRRRSSFLSSAPAENRCLETPLAQRFPNLGTSVFTEHPDGGRVFPKRKSHVFPRRKRGKLASEATSKARRLHLLEF